MRDVVKLKKTQDSYWGFLAQKTPEDPVKCRVVYEAKAQWWEKFKENLHHPASHLGWPVNGLGFPGGAGHLWLIQVAVERKAFLLGLLPPPPTEDNEQTE